LQLVENHQRQHDQPERGVREQRIGHRDAGHQALFRTAEDDRDLVSPRQSHTAGNKRHSAQHRGQQCAIDGDQYQEVGRRHARPDAGQRRGADKTIDHQQNRAPVYDTDQPLPALQPLLEPALQELAHDEWEQQVEDHRTQAVQRRASLGMQHKRDKQRRQHDAGDARQRRAAQRRRHVAARDRRKDDRGLHRRRQGAEKQKADIERRRENRAGQGAQGQPEHRKRDERGSENDQVQAPVHEPGHHRRARQPRALQEEQQRNPDLAGYPDQPRKRAAARQDDRQRHDADDRERKPVRDDTCQSAHRFASVRFGQAGPGVEITSLK
jgi:hypothetical protein